MYYIDLFIVQMYSKNVQLILYLSKRYIIKYTKNIQLLKNTLYIRIKRIITIDVNQFNRSYDLC